MEDFTFNSLSPVRLEIDPHHSPSLCCLVCWMFPHNLRVFMAVSTSWISFNPKHPSQSTLHCTRTTWGNVFIKIFSLKYFQDEMLDSNVTETYMGEWKNDKRCGFGISERWGKIFSVKYFLHLNIVKYFQVWRAEVRGGVVQQQEVRLRRDHLQGREQGGGEI